MTLSRRQFVRNISLAGGALTLGVSLTGCENQPLTLGSADDFHPNAFLRVDEDGKVTVQIPKAEMGQGVVTGLVTVIAEELELAPQSINYEMAPVHSAYRDPEFFMQITGGSASLRVYWDVLRQAAASARSVLIAAAAIQSGRSASELFAEDGEVRSQDGELVLSYGQLVATARTLAVPADVELKSPDQFRYIGKFDRRLDAREKSTGQAQFAMDVPVKGCLTAVVVRCPHHGGSVRRFNADKARQRDAVVDVFEIAAGVAVVATDYWQARQGANELDVVFTEPAHSLTSSADIESAMVAALNDPDPASIRSDPREGEPLEAILVEADYRVPFLAHATMEPQNATVHLHRDRCEIWVGSQSPDVARDIAARVLSWPREKVIVHNQFLGGGFGRRAAADNVAEAVEIAKHVGKPVRLIWSREDDTRHDFYRPAMAGSLKANVSPDGSVSDWQHKVAGPSINQQIFPQFGKVLLPKWVPSGVMVFAGNMVADKDFASVEGAADLPYTFNGVEVLYKNIEVPVPLGYWRSVGHSHSAFIVESFVDELAHAAGEDTANFRRRYLPADSRQLSVLERVLEGANWGKAKEGVYHGLAVHESFGTVVAQVAEISLHNGSLVVEKFYCAVDCGLVVNPDIVRDQIVGGIAFGLTAALHGEITLQDGAVQQSNFHDYPLLRHNEMPEVEVYIIDSAEAPSGIGEPGTPPAAPALANAIFAATGERLRSLPLRLS